MSVEIEGVKFVLHIHSCPVVGMFVAGVRFVTKGANETVWTSDVINTMGDFGREIERLKAGVDSPTETDFLH